MPEIAVIIPCYNEALSIEKVISDFKLYLPLAKIYVYDNNSNDGTGDIAKKAGAIVRIEKKQGKGCVVRRMFRDVEADYYIMADGDATYQISKAPQMLDFLINNKLDMVVGRRVAVDAGMAYRFCHVSGNKLFTFLISLLFGQAFEDVFSGYRVLSRRFVKSFSVSFSSFEIETELAIHALDQNLSIAEIETEYYPRPNGSRSKLNTYRDGLKILLAIVYFTRHNKPILFYGTISLFLFLVSIVLAVPIIANFIAVGTVERLPTAVLCTGLSIISTISMACGLILDSVSKMGRSLKQLHYLSQ